MTDEPTCAADLAALLAENRRQAEEIERLRGERARLLACIEELTGVHSNYRGFCGECSYQWPCAVFTALHPEEPSDA